MADIQKILNQFTELGIENKGLTPDNPAQQKVLSEAKEVKPATASDFATLAGVTQPNLAVQSNPVVGTATVTDKQSNWTEVEKRLDKIESQLSSLYESINQLVELSSDEYRARKKALQDIKANKHTRKDPALVKAVMKATSDLEKEKEMQTNSVENMLTKSFASYLDIVENNKND
tara:strand:+ start:245 stop:769 length:525 start_codon:yes stop_codon:yes gene_type:complete